MLLFQGRGVRGGVEDEGVGGKVSRADAAGGEGGHGAAKPDGVG
jgi:hypothetical protein